MKEHPITILIDAKNCLYRHNFTSNLTDPEGNKISGVFGMVKDVTKFVNTYKPDQVIVAWDVGKSVKRIEMYPDYKANRKKDDRDFLENIIYQTKLAKKIFGALPVKQIAVKNTEADDIIGLFVKGLKGNKVIASNDTDFIQLISEDTKIVTSRRSKVTELTHENVDEHLGYSKKHYVLHKALVGDSSDNIKGIKGIGPKTATKIVKDGKLPEKIDREKLKLNMQLIKIGNVLTKENILEIKKQYKDQSIKKPNMMIVRATFEKLRFGSILTNFNGMMHGYKQLYFKGMKNGKNNEESS